jgi:SAM-dependent methyltransferase
VEDWPIEPLFDEDYLLFLGASQTEASDDAEAGLVARLGELGPGSDVLDLGCGHGRIANRLAAGGARVAGLDATPLFLDLARRDAERRGVGVGYVQGDMRALPWGPAFDAVVSWFTAYGYFDDAQNRAVLAEVRRVLRPGGRFLVELNHKDGLLPHWLPSTVTEVDGALQVDERDYDPVTGRSHARRTIVRDGRVRHVAFFVRMFSYTELRDWLLDAGFVAVDGYGDGGMPLTAASRRMIVVARAA